MSTLEIILTVFTTLFGAGNIWQFVTVKSMREKAQYDADNAYIKNLENVINLQAEEIRRLQERQAYLEERIMELEKRSIKE